MQKRGDFLEKELSAAKLQVISALLTSPTYEEAAKRAGISVRTIFNYKKDPAFIERYEAEKKQIISHTADQLKRSLSDSVLRLWAIVNDPDAAPTAQVTAARAILDFGLSYTEMTDVLSRLAALEAKIP